MLSNAPTAEQNPYRPGVPDNNINASDGDRQLPRSQAEQAVMEAQAAKRAQQEQMQARLAEGEKNHKLQAERTLKFLQFFKQLTQGNPNANFLDPEKIVAMQKQLAQATNAEEIAEARKNIQNLAVDVEKNAQPFMQEYRQAVALTHLAEGDVRILQNNPDLAKLSDNLPAESRKELAQAIGSYQKDTKVAGQEARVENHINKLMTAATNIIAPKQKQETVKQPTEPKKSIKDILVKLRIELGKRFQLWDEDDVIKYLTKVYKDNPQKMAQLAQEFLGISKQELDKKLAAKSQLQKQPAKPLLASEQLKQIATGAEKAKEQASANNKDQILHIKETSPDEQTGATQKVSKETKSLSQIVSKEIFTDIYDEHDPQKLDRKSRISISARANLVRNMVHEQVNQAIGIEDGNVITTQIDKAEIEQLVEKEFQNFALDAENNPKSLERIELEKEATKQMLYQKIDTLDHNRAIYFKKVVQQVAAKEGFAVAEEDLSSYQSMQQKGLIDKVMEYKKNTNVEEFTAIEAQATLELRNNLLKSGIESKLAALKGENIEIPEAVLNQLNNLYESKLDQITVNFDQGGFAILSFNNFEDLSLFDLTITKDKQLVYTMSGPKPFISGVAFTTQGFMAVHKSLSPELLAHERAHLEQQLVRESKLKALKERTASSMLKVISKETDWQNLSEEQKTQYLNSIKALLPELTDRDDLRLSDQQIAEQQLDINIINRLRDLLSTTEGAEPSPVQRKLNRYKNAYTSIHEQIDQLAPQEELGSRLINLNLQKDEKITINSLKIDSADKFDHNNEQHLARLALIRFLNELNNNNPEEFAKKQILLGKMIINEDVLNLATVAQLINRINSTKDFKKLLTTKVRTKSSDELNQFLNPQNNTIDLQRLLGLAGLKSTSNLRINEINALWQYLTDQDGNLQLDLLSDEVREELVKELKDTPYSQSIAFHWRQVVKSQIFNAKDAYPTLVPFFVTGRPSWPLRLFGIQGTGSKGAETIAHIMRGPLTPLRKLIYPGAELAEFDPDKVIPFGLSANPWVDKHITPTIRKIFVGKNGLEGHKGKGFEHEMAPLVQMGAKDRIQQHLNSIVSTTATFLNTTQFEAFELLNRIGGIDINWQAMSPVERLNDFNNKDEYRKNDSLRAFVESLGVDPDLQGQVKKIADDEYLILRDGSKINTESLGDDYVISKGTITSSLLSTMRMFAIDQDSGQKIGEVTVTKDQVSQIGMAMMNEDHNRFTTNQGKYNIADLIEEINRVDTISPFYPDNDYPDKDYPSGVIPGKRRHVKINGQMYDIQAAREFVSMFYMARTHQILHGGMYNSEKVVLKDVGGTLKIVKPKINLSTGRAELDNTGNIIFIEYDLKDRDQLNNEFDYSYLAKIYHGKPIPANGLPVTAYNTNEIQKDNYYFQGKLPIQPIHHLNKANSELLFGAMHDYTPDKKHKWATGQEKTIRVDKDGYYPGRLTFETLQDSMGEAHRGIKMYYKFIFYSGLTDMIQRVSDNAEKMWGFWTHVDKTMRWIVLGASIAAIINPAFLALVPNTYLIYSILGTLGWAHTVSPFLNKLQEDWDTKKKAAEATQDFMRQSQGMFEEARHKRLDTTTLNFLDNYLKRVKNESKGLGKVVAKDFDGSKSNRMQKLTSDMGGIISQLIGV